MQKERLKLVASQCVGNIKREPAREFDPGVRNVLAQRWVFECIVDSLLAHVVEFAHNITDQIEVSGFPFLFFALGNGEIEGSITFDVGNAHAFEDWL